MDLKEIETRFRKEIEQAVSETNLPCEVCFLKPADKIAFLCEGRNVIMSFACRPCYDQPHNWIDPNGNSVAEKIHFKDINKS